MCTAENSKSRFLWCKSLQGSRKEQEIKLKTELQAQVHREGRLWRKTWAALEDC